MPATIAGSHLGLDTHANRPAANAAGQPFGALYSCSTHGLIYKTDGSTWSTYATLGGSPSGSITASGYTQATAKLLGRSTASTGAIEEITVGSGLSLSGGSLSASGGGGGHTVLSDTFNRANGAVGHADGGGLQLWDAISGTWAISSNTLNETSNASEKVIFIYTGLPAGKRTITWVMNTKPTGGDGGFLWRATPVATSATPNSALLLNVEVTYKLYTLTNGATYTAVAVGSGAPATPANGDSIVITDDGYEVTVIVNGGSPVVYNTLQGFTATPNAAGPFVGFRSSSNTAFKQESILVVDL